MDINDAFEVLLNHAYENAGDDDAITGAIEAAEDIVSSALVQRQDLVSAVNASKGLWDRGNPVEAGSHMANRLIVAASDVTPTS